MIIRNAEKTDVPEISKVHAYSWKTAYKDIIPQGYLESLQENFWVPAFDSWINEGVFQVKVAEKEEQIIGCITYGKAREESYTTWGEIVSLYLLPAYMHLGIGRKLLETAIGDMKNQYTAIYLWVLEENRNARKFYEKHGFQQTEDRLKFEIHGKEQIDLRYVSRF